jgi:hypothetical protein
LNVNIAYNICNQPVAGSIPIASSNKIKPLDEFLRAFFMPESPMSHHKKKIDAFPIGLLFLLRTYLPANIADY